MSDVRIILGGKIYRDPWNSIENGALVVQGERISWVGPLSELPERWKSGGERKELTGKVLLPGFNDNHLHTAVFGDNETYPSLTGLNEGQILRRLEERFSDWPKGELIMAFGWDYPECPEPHRSLLDKRFPDNPVALIQFSGHGAWVNSRMLEKLRIDRETPEPEGGVIVRDERGEPTGILRDAALHAIHRERFMVLHRDRRRLTAAVERALGHYREYGITSVQDNTWLPQTIGVLRKLKREGRLTSRFSCWPYGVMPWVARFTDLRRFDPFWFRKGPWKYFLDGTFSTRTAWLLEPYPGEPENRGTPVLRGEELDKVLLRAAKKKRQAAFHAIGDGAIHEFLDRLESVARAYPVLKELRLRLEHAQLVDPLDMERLAELGVLIAAQPHAMGNPRKDVEILGKERALHAYPHKSLLKAGVPLSFGSDIPGEPTVRPFQAIHYVVNREGPEALSLAEAISAYTLGSAYAEFMEKEKGTLQEGKLADFIVLDLDPFEVASERIETIEVSETWVGGRQVFSREEVAGGS
ncbi:MAG: amidohydrolase [Spirochaetaceae bacterium]